ncbi:MAG: AraC family transcriptional regulator [Arachnia propionica]|uniref:AraC family transcriptional regulator n=1 Tax=Arachnia propionica TaxID=1750 RepID=UPI00270FF005|nr:AraC family transcriptional regulator [Arachnia propionica]
MTLSPAEKAALLLAENPEHDWRLEELAGLVHLSVSQLGRVFIRRFDLSPMRFLMSLRAHRLARLLLETDLSITEAMERVGWHSRGHAARHFKATFGVSPSRYRASSRSISRPPQPDL